MNQLYTTKLKGLFSFFILTGREKQRLTSQFLFVERGMGKFGRKDVKNKTRKKRRKRSEIRELTKQIERLKKKV